MPGIGPIVATALVCGRPAILKTASARGVKLFTPLICNLC